MSRALAATVALGVALALPSRGEELAPPAGETWREIAMDRLVVCGDATEANLREVAESFERLRAALATLTPGGRPRNPVPTVIVVFRSDDELQRYGLRKDGKPIRVSGFYRSSPEANRIGLSASWNEDPRPIVYHELLHEFLRWNFPPQPLWFDEGMAEYYSTFTATRKKATVGRIREEHLRLLRETAPMPLEELLAVGKESRWYSEDSRRGLFYAQSWALTHYLLHADPALQPRLFRYLKRTREGVERRAAFFEAFGRTEASVLADLVAYVRGARFTSYTVPFDAGLAEPPPARVLSRADVLARLAGLLLPDATRDAETGRLVSEALALQPDHPAALAAQARLAARAGRVDDERALLRRAAAAPGAGAGVLYDLGMALLPRPEGDGGPERWKVAIAEARRALERALELDPAFTPARVALGRTYLAESGASCGPGITYLETARAEGAADPRLAVEIEELHRRRDGAPPPVAAGTGAQKSETAGGRVRAETEEVNRLLAEGKDEDALARLEALHASLGEEPGYRAAIEEDLVRLREVAAQNGLVRKYNDGMRLVREGKLGAALRLFREVASGSKDPGLTTAAREMAASIEKTMPTPAPKKKS